MYNKTEIKALKDSINKLTACNGDCRNCSHCQMDFASGERAIYYAFRCDEQPDFMVIRSNSPTTLRKETVDGLFFELS